MPRPKKTPPVAFWGALTREQLLESPLRVELLRLAATPAVQGALTVLINERPSAMGVANADQIIGYEACLRSVLELFQVRPMPQAVADVTEDYSTPQITKELSWESPGKP